MTNDRGSWLGWVVAGIGLIVVIAGFELGNSTASARVSLRSEHAHPASSATPADMMVVVSKDGKTFHRADCRYIHDPAQKQAIPAKQAIEKGYVPCIRCLRQYAR